MKTAPEQDAASFAIELATYEHKLPELLGDAGRFVLIRGQEVAGIFDTYQDAVSVGYDRFKFDRFFVKQIAPAERIVFFARVSLAH